MTPERPPQSFPIQLPPIGGPSSGGDTMTYTIPRRPISVGTSDGEAFEWSAGGSIQVAYDGVVTKAAPSILGVLPGDRASVDPVSAIINIQPVNGS